MIQLSKEEVLQNLKMKDCISAMRQVLLDLEQGRAQQYLRTVTPLPAGGLMGYMPAAVQGMFGAKLITVFHSNMGTEYPSHQGSVLLFEEKHGSLLAMVDGGAVTQVRTGAVSAVATDLLAAKEAGVLALLGAGVQARSHLLAIQEVRTLRQVTVWDIRPEAAQNFAREMSLCTGLPITACATAQEAVKEADIICTVTGSSTPVLQRAWVKPGAHINAVGACAPKDREIDSALMAASRVYGDSAESVLAESGDFLIPLQEGVYSQEHLLGTLGQLLAGACIGRTEPEQITLFEALGLAVEDIACAKLLYQNRA